MCRLTSLLDSILWCRELRLVAGGSCQVLAKHACLSFCSGLSSRNGGAASASGDFIWSNVWCTWMSQDSLSSCWGCLSRLCFPLTTHACGSECGHWMGCLLSQVCSPPWQGKDWGDHADTSFLASHLYIFGHLGERRSLMGRTPVQQQPPHQTWPGSRNQTRIRMCATQRSLDTS